MSAAPRYPADIGYAGLRMSAEEFLALGETPERYELINGVVVMSPSPTPFHQMIVVELLQQILAWRKARAGTCVLPGTDLRLGSGKVYRPDILAYAAGRLPTAPERLDTPPDLVVEVLSPGSKALDLITKRDDYEGFGIGEYWVIDPAGITARVWRRAGAKLLEAGVEGDTVECAALAGLRVDLGAIRRALG